MTLSNRQLDLLDEIVSSAQDSAQGLDAVRFRADHEDDLDDLDELERRRFVERHEDRWYVVRMPALSAVRARNQRAEKSLFLAEVLFDVLRNAYKANPGAQIPIADLAKTADSPFSDTCRGLFYLLQAPLWGSYTANLHSPNAFVSPSEAILKFKNFRSVLEQMERWTQPTIQPAAGGREKQQKFGILDSPRLLAIDLQQPSGASGTALIYLDLDHFKQANTEFTEALVDELILPPIHHLIAACVDRVACAYAEGGDEFVVLLENFTEEMASAFAENLRARIEAAKFKGQVHNFRLTASLGIAHAHAGEDTSTLKHRANQAKNFAKSRGKNAVAVWRTPEAQILSHQLTPKVSQPSRQKRQGVRAREQSETVDMRIARIIKVTGLERAYDGSVLFKEDDKNVTLELPTKEAEFELFYLIADDNIEEYWYLAYEDVLHVDSALADIRVLLRDIERLLALDPKATTRFVIATNSDVSTVRDAITRRFERMKTIASIPTDAVVELQLWDPSEVTEKELELGIRIEPVPSNKSETLD